MPADAYLVRTAAGRHVSLDRARAEQYAAEHRGTLHTLATDDEDAERIEWLERGGLVQLINATIDGLESDVLCCGAFLGAGPADVRSLIDRLRSSGT